MTSRADVVGSDDSPNKNVVVGILVDDATVEVETFHRQHVMGKPVLRAILDGAAEIAVPALVSRLSQSRSACAASSRPASSTPSPTTSAFRSAASISRSA